MFSRVDIKERIVLYSAMGTAISPRGASWAVYRRPSRLIDHHDSACRRSEHLPRIARWRDGVRPRDHDFTLAAIIIAAIFKYVPNAAVDWRAALAGGMFTAVLFALGLSLGI
jgi:hypothetical protein